MFGKDKDKQKKKKEKMNGKAGHSEENYNVLYDNLAFPEVYAKEQKQSDTEKFRPLLMSGLFLSPIIIYRITAV